MNYQETVAFLYEQLPLFSRIGAKAYKKDLDNIQFLCNQLENPQLRFKSIHIAGTNGKGSCSHMLASIFQSAGYKTGLYTSPHLFDFRERIRINGLMIPEDSVVRFVEKITPLHIEPSFFEITVAMAFDFFAQEKVDIAIIETGLGGRLDSTNIIIPALSVITNIGMDHMDLLGDTPEQIAFEKAGIIKCNRPVVIGKSTNLTLPVFQKKSAETKAPLYEAEKMIVCTRSEINDSGRELHFHYPDQNKNIIIQTDLSGKYQEQNVTTVLASIQILNNLSFNLNDTAVQSGLSNVKKNTGLRGRWDILSKNPTVIADVAHNTDGIREMLRQLKYEYAEKKLHFIIGFVKDKDISEILEQFPKEAEYYFTNAHIPRALPHLELKLNAAASGLEGNSYDDINDALEAARGAAAGKDVIMICGSFFTIGELRI